MNLLLLRFYDVQWYFHTSWSISFLSNIFLCQFGWTFTVEQLEEKHCQTQTDLVRYYHFKTPTSFSQFSNPASPHCRWCLDTMLGHVWSTSRPSAEDVDLRGDAWREFFFEKIGGPHLKGSRKISVFLFLRGHVGNDHWRMMGFLRRLMTSIPEATMMFIKVKTR